MIFKDTKLAGVCELQMSPTPDARGFFARAWCQREFEDRGLNSKLVQCNVSSNIRRGTLRGLHYQAAPFPEAKLIRCTKGAIYDVVVDLRRNSSTFKDWIGVALSDVDRNMVYIPEGCGHGFLTLEDDTEVFYQMSEYYHPELACGVRWNDPTFAIEWPSEPTVISERDRNYPDFG